jgi:glycosyltransferase involved in cell wall biosynthesis
LPISYVIPAYNCAGTIGEAVDSIRDGNLDPGDEIILVDDASTDNTGPMLTEMERAIPNIRMLTHRINKGTAAAARNTAIEAAAHSLIFCLDSDNVLASRSVQNLRDHLVSTGADAAAFGEIHYFRDKVANVTHQWRYRDNVHLADALAGSAWPGPSGNYLFTRESWLRAGRYYEPSLENRSLDSWAFGIRQLSTGSRMVSLPGTWYFHRYGHDSHYILNWQKGNQSLAALMVLVPFLDQLDPRDVDYLFSREGRYTWYSRLAERPIHVLSREAGRDGEVHLSGKYRLSEVRRTAKSMLNKIRSRIGRKDPRRQVSQ